MKIKTILTGGVMILFACTINAQECVPAADGLVAWWPGDADASDIRGGNDGIFVNGATAGVPGQVGGAFSFDGDDDFVDIESNSVFDITDALTMEAWIYLTEVKWDQKILSYYQPYEMGIFNDKLEFLPASDGGVSTIHRETPGGTVLQTNTWYHVVTTWDGATITSYINGAVDRSAAYSDPLDVGTNNFSIGRASNGGIHFSGLIDEAALYASALTAGEVQAIYDSGSAGNCKVGDDSDGDGVNDDFDNCPNTVIPESMPTRSLGVNRFALVDGDGLFDTKPPKGKGPQRSYSITDTTGCSCTQIIEAQGLGGGHTKFGCSISAMDDWVDLVN